MLFVIDKTEAVRHYEIVCGVDLIKQFIRKLLSQLYDQQYIYMALLSVSCY